MYMCVCVFLVKGSYIVQLDEMMVHKSGLCAVQCSAGKQEELNGINFMSYSNEGED